ncbi:NAD(P)-dependent dehydrogenase (short-subunit alcohol dehydrogenase family) [Aeromicrobium panaciterrae]|uniref:NAD(P)-dependent dehydrogenase (Short-subunit alcohol dehydrogenase family) n=1 Tax=Aeromicrobium panaciterrae TaxID=363861 RepID=A0ABU1UMP9_9ACTN|nr:SDR family NAD(P)-dependent oxidoreductase [Aeromicrobium panaciterrae]MDR7086405.1 NAD(P)-dependent dehydrogenase (short-subunit alcohol dehydrogenase family) [Aeromicrobium panaciterrae]
MAIVTGSSDGIGFATAQRLLQSGATVVVNGRDLAKLDAACARLEEFTGEQSQVVGVVGDAADEQTLDQLIITAESLGGVHIAVANVGGGTVGVGVDDLTREALQKMWDFNVVSTALLIQRVAPVMRTQGYGRVVTVSSFAGRRYGRVSGPDYSAAKAAVSGLTRHAAAELAPFGVTVNCVAPGIIATSRALGMVAEKNSESTDSQTTPIGRMGTPDEVAAAIAFLASPDASFITGVTLDVSGGAFMG